MNYTLIFSNNIYYLSINVKFEKYNEKTLHSCTSAPMLLSAQELIW